MSSVSEDSTEIDTQVHVAQTIGLDKETWIKNNPEPASWEEWNETRLRTFMMIDQLKYEDEHGESSITIDTPRVKYLMEYAVRHVPISILVSMKYIYPPNWISELADKLTSSVFLMLNKHPLPDTTTSNITKEEVLSYITKLVNDRYASIE